MNQAGEEAAKELGVTQDDIRRLRLGEDKMRGLLLLSAAAVASMISFILGYIAEMEDPHFTYPYASAALATSASGIRGRHRRLSFVVIPLLALIMFFVGMLTANPAEPPNYGIAPEYSVFSRE